MLRRLRWPPPLARRYRLSLAVPAKLRLDGPEAILYAAERLCSIGALTTAHFQLAESFARQQRAELAQACFL